MLGSADIAVELELRGQSYYLNIENRNERENVRRQDEIKRAEPGKADQVSAFLAKVAATPAVKSASGRGRLLFAMDATASREPSWDQACHLQAEMFQATDGLGGLEVQLVFFRGFGECKSSPWVSTSGEW